MTREEAKRYWLFRYANTKDYSDQNWDAQERREHRDYVEALLMAIEALSAEAVQGEWIHDGQNFKGGIDWCHCSECGQKTSTNGLDMYKFCPNCGTRMRGEEE